MSRTAPRLFRFCVFAAAALATLAVCAAWAWSYFMRELVEWSWRDGTFVVITAVEVERGTVRVRYDGGHGPRPPGVPLDFVWSRAGARVDGPPAMLRAPAASTWGLLGFGYARRPYPPPPFAEVTVSTPLWFVALVTAAPLLLRVRRVVRVAVRRRRGRCPACGYDLRETPERCPECGTAAVATNAPIAL